MNLHTSHGFPEKVEAHEHSEKVGPGHCWVKVDIGGVDLAIHFQSAEQIVELGSALVNAGKMLQVSDHCNDNTCGQAAPASVYHGQQVQGNQPRENGSVPGCRPPDLGRPLDPTDLEDPFLDTAEHLRRVAQDLSLAAGSVQSACRQARLASDAIKAAG